MIKKFIVDRNRWLRGQGLSTGLLKRSKDEKFCILGFLCSACGISDENFTDLYDLRFLDRKDILKLPNWLFSRKKSKNGDIKNSLIALTLMEENDYKYLSDEKREKRIKEIFIKKGIKVEFIN